MMDIKTDKRISIMIVLGLVAVTWAIYGQILFHDFISYDDPTYITENSNVQAGLTAESVSWAFSSGYASNWHPLTWLSLMLDYEVWGGKAGGFLATNLILHTLNALLLFWIMKKMTGSVIGSVFIAGIFAWHPLHVASPASIYNDLANALVKQKKYDEAIENYSRAIQLEPTFARAYYNKGMALSEQNRLAEAIEEFRHVLRFYPKDAEMHCNVGTLLLRHGDVEAAIEEFRTSLRYDPDLSRAQRQLEAALTEKQ